MKKDGLINVTKNNCHIKTFTKDTSFFKGPKLSNNLAFDLRISVINGLVVHSALQVLVNLRVTTRFTLKNTS